MRKPDQSPEIPELSAIADDCWFADFASGSGPMAVRALMSAHVEINAEAAERAALVNAVAAEIALSDIASTFGSPEIAAVADSSAVSTADPVYPAALAHLGFSSAVRPWRSHLGGVSARKVKRLCEPGVDARLFRFEPGAAIPKHDHAGDELTLVLSGGFADENGIYHRGDVSTGRAGEPHQPMGLPGEPCICFAVSVGGYRFRNPLMALAARWLS
ncbi:MAG: hypothetical protein CMF74_04350 [Maricaulis sp.]|jgi:putative transcriptional regulator|nr:hypothetical protein [Maricaulis sp.]HAQ36271.1 hypothetical protein [Alphaproteobacteria bacterium]|tara:strand:+ start:312 stop:959 length:648 start_codon:yes stop_codon:yes gene_type:complete